MCYICEKLTFMQERLRRLMKAEAINSSRLAEILGIQSSGISHILSGRNNPSFDFVVKILNRFPQVNPDWLITGKGPMYRDSVKNATSQPDSMVSDTVPERAPLADTVSPVAESSVKDEVSDFGIPIPDMSGAQNSVLADTDDARKFVSSVSEHSSKNVERVVVMYSDGTFDNYSPNIR